MSVNVYAEKLSSDSRVSLSQETFVLGGYSLQLPPDIKSIHALTGISLVVKYSKHKKVGLTLLRNDGVYPEEFPVPSGVTLARYFDLLYSNDIQTFTELAEDRRAFLPKLTSVAVYETEVYKAIMATINLESFNRRAIIYRKSDPTTVLDLLASNLSNEQIKNIISSFTYTGI